MYIQTAVNPAYPEIALPFKVIVAFSNSPQILDYSFDTKAAALRFIKSYSKSDPTKSIRSNAPGVTFLYSFPGDDD